MTQDASREVMVDEAAREGRLAEERYLLATQRAMQRLMTAKGLRYRDLARRLGVSEARVSHIFGDDATNLTIRTVARVFHCLEEQPLIFSSSDHARSLAEARGANPPSLATWTVSAAADCFWVDPSAETVDGVTLPKDNGRPATTREWALAEDAAERRGRAA
jgi:transcriptional regulator with XRE-family HTH domain